MTFTEICLYKTILIKSCVIFIEYHPMQLQGIFAVYIERKTVVIFKSRVQLNSFGFDYKVIGKNRLFLLKRKLIIVSVGNVEHSFARICDLQNQNIQNIHCASNSFLYPLCRTEAIRWNAQQKVQRARCTTTIFGIRSNWGVYGATRSGRPKQGLRVRHVLVQNKCVGRHKGKFLHYTAKARELWWLFL